MNKDIFPKKEIDKANWLKNFNKNLPQFAATLDIDAATLSRVDEDTNNFSMLVNYHYQVKAYLRGLTTAKTMMLSAKHKKLLIVAPPALPAFAPDMPCDILGRTRKLMGTIKSHLKYNDSIGLALGIIATKPDVDTINWKPEIKLKLSSMIPELVWKKGMASGLKIFADYGDGEGMKFIAINTIPNFFDHHPLPPDGEVQVWKYRCIYLLKDEPVGQYSDVVSVVVQGKPD